MGGRVLAHGIRRRCGAGLAAFALIASSVAARQQTPDGAAAVDPPAERAGVFCAAGEAAHDKGQYAVAREHALQCAEIYDSVADVRGRAVATLQYVRLGLSARGEDLRLLRDVIADARAVGDRSIEGR